MKEFNFFMKIKITSDSTCDLPQELIEKHAIDILPLYVTVEGKSYRDGVNIQAAEMLTMTETSGGTPKTAANNVQDYLDAFKAARKDHDAVIHFTISSSMSACYQNACLAAGELENIYVIDSANLSTGQGLLVLDACEMAEAGMEPEAIVAEIEARKEKVDASFVVDTLEYLRRGGRCSALAAMGANLLRLHPSIYVKDGAMIVGKKFRGSMKTCLTDYVKDRLSEADSVDPRRVFITDSGVTEEIRQTVEETVRSLVPFVEVIHSQAGCTVSCHCGRGTLGILFFRK